MEEQEYVIVDHLDLDNTIRENLSNLLKSVKKNTVSVNKGIDNIGKQILDDFDEFDEKDFNYFTGLPGEKITIIDSTFCITKEEFIDFLKTHKYSWYCVYYSDFQKDNIHKLSSEDVNKKPLTRNSKKSNAIFLDQYNNPIIFVNTPNSSNSKIFYFKLNVIEFPKIVFNLRNVFVADISLQSLAKKIIISVIKYPYTNIKESFSDSNNLCELGFLEVLEQLNYHFSKLKMLLDVVEQHKNVVDKSNELNSLIKRYKLLESNYLLIRLNNENNENELKNLKKKLDDVQDKNIKYKQYHSATSKENLELKKKYKLLLQNHRKLKKTNKNTNMCNVFYFIIILVLVGLMLILDIIYKPDKLQILNNVSSYVYKYSHDFSLLYIEDL